MEAPVTSGILCTNASQTIPSELWITQKSLRINSTRSCTTRGARSTPRVTTRCSSVQSYASPSGSLPDVPKKKHNKEDDNEDKKDPDRFQKPENMVNVIFGGDPSFSKRAQKLLLREILSVEPTIQRPLMYSEVPITFSREDQWTSFSEPGKFPLVLDPVVQGSKPTRVLIDGGSGLNLLFASTLHKMGLDFYSMLTPSKAPFFGIVPGNSSTRIGSVTLPVTVGSQNWQSAEADWSDRSGLCNPN